jgi:radical SAM family protein/iron-sulfur cluster protein
MSLEDGKAFCILPWIHLAVFPEGSAKLCCVASRRVNDGRAALSLQSLPLEQVWNSPYMRDVRRDMAAGRFVKDCAVCYRGEKADGVSRRTEQNARWRSALGPAFDAVVEEAAARNHRAPQPPIYYQLMPGNLCNLKCRMCFPTFSSLIEKDAVHSRWSGTLFESLADVPDARPGSAALSPTPPGTSRLPEGPWYRDDAWVRDVLLKNTEQLRALYFTGGEPMIETQVENILDHLIAAGVAGNVFLEFNTNCTVLREPMVAKLQQFKMVVAGLSIDAYGPCHEYIRYPSRWSAIRRNVERLVPLQSERFHVHAGPVLQVYNLLSFVDVLRFFDELGLAWRVFIAGAPAILAVRVLPGRIRRLAAERLRSYAAGRPAHVQAELGAVTRHLEAGPDRVDRRVLRDLMLFTNDLDAGRRQSVREVHGELLALLAEEGFRWTDERSPDVPART